MIKKYPPEEPLVKGRQRKKGLETTPQKNKAGDCDYQTLDQKEAKDRDSCFKSKPFLDVVRCGSVSFTPMVQFYSLSDLTAWGLCVTGAVRGNKARQAVDSSVGEGKHKQATFTRQGSVVNPESPEYLFCLLMLTKTDTDTTWRQRKGIFASLRLVFVTGTQQMWFEFPFLEFLVGKHKLWKFENLISDNFKPANS